GPGEAVGKLGAGVLSHAPQDSCSARAAHVPRWRARQFQRANRTPASAAALPCRTATSSITNAITSGGRTRPQNRACGSPERLHLHVADATRSRSTGPLPHVAGGVLHR
ncbi:hypothetical protein, partial [Xanthomonas euvesicatoria]|uniref:hypothetical protein n=1 Tax=Xanthomonas euvesicatoria TaxID=456327 RepID=UPI0019D3D570